MTSQRLMSMGDIATMAANAGVPGSRQQIHARLRKLRQRGRLPEPAVSEPVPLWERPMARAIVNDLQRGRLSRRARQAAGVAVLVAASLAASIGVAEARTNFGRNTDDFNRPRVVRCVDDYGRKVRCGNVRPARGEFRPAPPSTDWAKRRASEGWRTR